MSHNTTWVWTHQGDKHVVEVTDLLPRQALRDDVEQQPPEALQAGEAAQAGRDGAVEGSTAR